MATHLSLAGVLLPVMDTHGTVRERLEESYGISRLQCSMPAGRIWIDPTDYKVISQRSTRDGTSECTWVGSDGILRHGTYVKDGLDVGLYDEQGRPLKR